MNIKNNIYILLFASALPFILGGCRSEEPVQISGDAIDQLTVTATILPMSSDHNTRASVNELNYDGWSYKSFEIGDFMGFYSEHGDYYTDNGDGSILNLPLEYIGNSQFRNENNFVFSPSKMSANTIFMYYPYSADLLDSDNGYLDAPGMELRIENDGVYKCVDLLDNASLDVGALAYGSITGTFRHAFSELIIMRGEGFNNPPAGKDQIWVVMQNPFTHLRVNFTTEPQWSCYPEFINQASYTPEGFTGTFDPKKWEAWQGGNYSITMQDEGVPAWYALLPCIGENNPLYTVEYIELYDNDGNLQKVTSLKLSERPNDKTKFTKILKQSWRYPLLVEMKELVPTVNPYPITPWTGDTDITNERKRGISNAFEFQTWLGYYNAYLSNGEYDNLLQFGDRIVDADGNTIYWHFYLLNDIDLTQMNYEGDISQPLIPRLFDVLDGVNMNELENNTRPNYSITGLNHTLVGTMSGYGTLQNIDFIEPNINSASTSPAGILVNTMTIPTTVTNGNATGGLIYNCNITQGTLTSLAEVGAIAGQIQGATIQNCSATGFLIGTSTLDNDTFLKLVGSQTGANTVENNESDVIFTPVN